LLGSFLDATIAMAKQIGNATVTPVSSPESRKHPSDDFDDAYIELDDSFIDECQATSDAGAIRDLLARRAVRYKLSPWIYLTYLLLRKNLFVVPKVRVLWST
jgi:hypothetical protein